MNSLKAFVFPGQGSQSVGMGQFLYDEFRIVRDTFAEASAAINFDIKKLCFTSSEQELALTENTQPALLTVSVATSRVLTEILGIKPDVTAGHSIGEYSSFVLGSVFTFKEAVQAVRLRGQAMQKAVPAGQGGMTAVLGITSEQAEFLCQWACENSGHSPLSPANFNCDGQIVISGNQLVLDWLKVNFKPTALPGEVKKVKLIPLQVSAPFHCEMMKPAEDKMADFFSKIMFHDSKIPILQNVLAKKENQAQSLKKNLIEQVTSSVKWTQTMQELKQLNASTVIECGNGNVLKGLFKKADSEYFKVYSTSSLADLKTLEQALII